MRITKEWLRSVDFFCKILVMKNNKKDYRMIQVEVETSFAHKSLDNETFSESSFELPLSLAVEIEQCIRNFVVVQKEQGKRSIQ
jgi:uncharacterized protein YqgQ